MSDFRCTETERVSVIETKLHDHMHACDLAHVQTEKHFIKLECALQKLTARVWWIIGLLVVGLATVTGLLIEILNDLLLTVGKS